MRLFSTLHISVLLLSGEFIFAQQPPSDSPALSFAAQPVSARNPQGDGISHCVCNDFLISSTVETEEHTGRPSASFGRNRLN
jgi:hypothetical protein